MLDYIIKVLLFQTLFLVVYDLFLKRETFFQWNRAYLIVTSILAYVIPYIKINRVQEIIPQEYVVMLPEIVLNPTAVIEKQFDWWAVFFVGLKTLFWIGVALASVLFIVRLYKIIKLIYTNKKEQKSNYFLVLLENSKAFSFFNYIFLGKGISEQNKKQIIAHELVHVQQKHSLDLLFFELQKIVFWFNPYSYLYQARMSELHEFIADSKSIKDLDKDTYFNNLIGEIFGVRNISFINPFLKPSLIKKRILMLNKNKSKQILKFKYVLLIPVLIGMLLYTSCGQNTYNIERDNNEAVIGLDEIVLGTYFQITSGAEAPKGEKISYESLSAVEKAEFDKWKESMLASQKKDIYEFKEFTIYETKDDKKTIHGAIEWKDKKNNLNNSSDGEDVPFAIIEKSPIFPGCEDVENPKKCLQENIQKHVSIKFNTGLAQTLGLAPGKKRVITIFKIDKEGNITDVRSRGPHADLEAEAIRVVNNLPKMIPGEQRGKKVGVKYTLPITLMIDGDSGKNQKSSSQEDATFKSQPKVVASIDNSLNQGVIAGNVNGLVNGELEGLPGVIILIKGGSTGATTDFNGNFKIKVKEGETLIFSFKNLPKTELKIGKNNNYNITM